MFLLLLLIGSTILALVAVRRGPRAAAAVAFACALGLPCWIYLEAGAIRIDIRTALALVGITCVWLHPQTVVRPRLLLADALVLGLVGTILASELFTGIVTQTVVVDLAVQWLVPYWLGRTVWSTTDDGDRLIAAVAPVCVALAAWAAVESITRINPLGLLAGHVGSSQAIHDLRWGLRRAEGPLIHPIFFGLHLVLMLPWALAAARQAGPDAPFWRRRLPWIVAAGAFFTMSRGPQLGVLIAWATAVVVLRPGWRPVVLAPLAVGLVVVATSGELVLDVLHTWSGETPSTVIIAGEPYPYTGTTHRLLQLRVYAEAVAHAGWLGYGSTLLHAGDTRVPHVAEDLRQMFTSIDNHYLQFVLQCGYLGLGLFAMLCLTTIGCALSAAARFDGALQVLAAATAGALLALTLLMASVWLAGDYRFLLLITMGSAAGMRSVAVGRRGAAARTAPAANPRTARASSLVPLQLSPGYRPFGAH